MIKSKANLALSILFFVTAAANFAGRNTAVGQPYHRYTWLMWLLCAAMWFYRAFRPGQPLPPREPRRTLPPGKSYPIFIVLFVAVALALPLWLEFQEHDQPFWNGFLAFFLITLVAGTFMGVRYLQINRIEFGEARPSSGEPNIP